jgi:predicted 3-demethylubiquinone-9 3-methyltransferase (glyoxalase superfamily)
MATIHPFIWFNGNAQEARDFYLSVFKNSKTLKTTEYTDGNLGTNGAFPHATYEFELEGLHLTAFNAGPQSPFNFRLSLYIETSNQAETDYYYDALTADGGSAQACGWLTDKFGVYWQVIPEALPRLSSDPDRAKADRVRQAMYGMHKIIIADLEAAYAG